MPWRRLLARLVRRPLRVWYHLSFRLPLSATAGRSASLELRRADDSVDFLVRARAIDRKHVVMAAAATYEELGRVHTAAYLESLSDPLVLANIFSVDPSEVIPEELLRTARLACGATVEAARWSLRSKQPALTLLGGFHHASPSRGGGFCALNDLAIAVQAVRADGFAGRIAVLDLDAHPPDGTVACLGGTPGVWLGSLSGVDWGELLGVDETVLPKGSGDVEYLAALDALLQRMPKDVALAFVIAGGDVVTGDQLGNLALSLPGVRERDLKVASRLEGVPSVWVPGGGYGPHAWKSLAGTGLALALRSRFAIPQGYDPVAARFSSISRTLEREVLGEEPLLTEGDLDVSLNRPRAGPPKLLGFYTGEGIEYALEKYAMLPLVRRLGYDRLHIEIVPEGSADRVRLMGRDLVDGGTVVLTEMVLERKELAGGTVLFVNWLSLRNPHARFSSTRPRLPGQDSPGLGLARETSTILGLVARRLLLDGVAFQPSWYHMAYAARHNSQFADPKRQGRFEALLRDLASVPLLEATHAVAEGRVRLNGEPYTWEPEAMVVWLTPREEAGAGAIIEKTRESSHFTLVPRPAAPVAAPAPQSAPVA